MTKKCKELMHAVSRCDMRANAFALHDTFRGTYRGFTVDDSAVQAVGLASEVSAGQHAAPELK